MKMNKKKKTAILALLLCILSILSLSTLAWFTATDDLTNTIVFSNDFEVDLYEHDQNGVSVDEGVTYEGVMPGNTIDKDPTVLNKSATEPQYIRMTVTVSEADAWTTGAGANIKGFFTDFDTANWTVDDGELNAEDDTFVITAYLNAPLQPGATATLFTKVKIPGGVNSSDIEKIGESFDIKVHADAIQASNLPESVTTCQGAFALIGK